MMETTAIVLAIIFTAGFIYTVKSLLQSKGDIDFEFNLKEGKGRFKRKGK